MYYIVIIFYLFAMLKFDLFFIILFIFSVQCFFFCCFFRFVYILAMGKTRENHAKAFKCDHNWMSSVNDEDERYQRKCTV